jgi:hypothetical protein
MSRTKMQGFTIRDFSGNIDACASFRLNGVEVSFTSIGYSKGSCLNEIVVYDDMGNALKLFCTTVEDAVKWVIENVENGVVIA